MAKTEIMTAGLAGEEGSQDAEAEQVVQLKLSELHPFEGHPFQVRDDEEMQQMVESLSEFGVLVPLIVRPDPYGGYEILSGHRRHRASELAEKETVPAIIRDLDDDAAIILMCDSNLQRENILPSERAWAYKMKLDAIKHQGKRNDLQQESTSSQVGTKLRADEQLAQQMGESRNQIQRYMQDYLMAQKIVEVMLEKDAREQERQQLQQEQNRKQR